MTNVTLGNSSAHLTNMGAIRWQGPHHVAVKSTTTSLRRVENRFKVFLTKAHFSKISHRSLAQRISLPELCSAELCHRAPQPFRPCRTKPHSSKRLPRQKKGPFCTQVEDKSSSKLRSPKCRCIKWRCAPGDVRARMGAQNPLVCSVHARVELRLGLELRHHEAQIGCFGFGCWRRNNHLIVTKPKERESRRNS